MLVDNDDRSDTLSDELGGNTKKQINPRLRCLEEVIALLRQDENSPTLDATGITADYISSLVSRLEDMKAPRPRGRPASATPRVAHTHFVGVSEDGSFTHFTSDRLPSKDNCIFTRVYGPFRRQAAAEYRVEKGIQEGDACVFE